MLVPSLPHTKPGYNYGQPLEFPQLREVKYGDSIRSRLTYQTMAHINHSGPPDLMHIGRYRGTTSSAYLGDDFIVAGNDKHEEGYVGNYHYVNGLYHDAYYSIENYIFNVVGIVASNGEYRFVDTSHDHYKREIVVTYCHYNIFTKSDLRIKYVISPTSSSKSSSLLIDKSFQILPNSVGKSQQASIGKLHDFNWDDINVSSIIRLFLHLDDASKQLPGLISVPQLIETNESIHNCLQLLVKYLPKGYLTEYNEGYGAITGCQPHHHTHGHHIVKTNVYRNNLIDSLIRLCDLDYTGKLTDYTIDLINNLGGDQWQYVILKLLKNSNGANISKIFVNQIHHYFQHHNIYSTQSCLILLEQIKFLITKKDYETALKLSKLTITIMPLDFECWLYLSLCYSLIGDYENCLLAFNSIPITLNQNIENFDLVSGINDEFSKTFLTKLNNNQEPINEKTFNKYFPVPHSIPGTSFSTPDNHSRGEIKKIWKDTFIFNSIARHPIMGNQFYQTPLICKTVTELSSVDGNLIKLTGFNSLKLKLSGYSANSISSSILDFTKKSTWGKCYNLLSYLVAKVGWDEMMKYKTNVFTNFYHEINSTESLNYVVSNNGDDNKLKKKIQPWLDQMFVLIYEDLKTLMIITSPDRTQNHSTLDWEMLGLLGWNVKYNLKFTISSLITSFLGSVNQISNYDINYFNSMQILIIYDEFILSEVNSSQVDNLGDDYSKNFYSNKLILKSNNGLFNNFLNTITRDYLTIDLILLILMRLISYNLRWYQFLPNYLIQKILIKLTIMHGSEFLMSKIKIIFETNKLIPKETGYFFKKILKDEKQFNSNDSIIEYFEKLFNWIETRS